jgi:glycosyltransferase involved in cell wall biosynthesis/SAM-dependent methyltransferase
MPETFAPSGRAGKPRLLILVVAYNAERNIQSVLARVPHRLADEYHVEVLVLDDSSRDLTFEKSREAQRDGTMPFRLHVLFNPVNQGYGGNQKIGYHFALEGGFDFVALLHGDGQYAPECLPDLVRPLRDGEADAVFGSRMLERASALRGGMPLYKFAGNRILTWFENRMLNVSLSEFHSGYRVYSVAALKKIPFALNTDDFHFDTEIIIQLLIAGQRIKELPIPTYYGDEICHVNGLKYAAAVARSVLVARCQRMGFLYDRRFDCEPAPANVHDEPTFDVPSPHSVALELVPQGARVVDLGCAGGYVSDALRRVRGCRVTAVDRIPPDASVKLDHFVLHDVNQGVPRIDFRDFAYVLLLDVIEHLSSPETFIEELRGALKHSPPATVLVSTGNIGFIVTRLMLLLGQFNYGKRGILDRTHVRLFTFASFRRLFQQGGFRIRAERGIPWPFQLMFGNGVLGRTLLALNNLLIRFVPGLFSYQMFFVVEPLPSLEYLLREASEQSAVRGESAERPTAAAR